MESIQELNLALTECPCCSGEGTIYFGNNKNPKSLLTDGDQQGSKSTSFRLDPGSKEMASELNMKVSDFIKNALLLGYSKKGRVVCPTCNGSGKIIGKVKS